MPKWLSLFFSFFLVILIGCEQLPPTSTSLIIPQPTTPTAVPATPSPTILPPSSTPLPTQSSAIASTNTPSVTSIVPTITPTPFFTGVPSPACGQILPLFSMGTSAPTTSLTPDANALAKLDDLVPDAAFPALRYLLNNPADVGLVTYRLGQEADGVYLNADTPMPLASIVKIIHLIAYAEAVADGQLNPLSSIPLSDLERYYLPNFDLGAHRRAVAELESNGRVFGDPPQIILDEIPWMMMRHSSNAATDYLHFLLGQEVIEQTAVSLNLSTHTAPCPFIGQFLAMSNHARTAFNDRAEMEAYLADPAYYSQQVTLLADAFIQNDQFRADEIAWRSDRRRSPLDAQRFFTANLNAQASPRDYAMLMARLAQNGLSSGDSSFTARRFLEWPMIFEDNQALFTNLGYKNGTLPGVLNTAYYAYPNDGTAPIVVILLFHNLPNSTYQQWRSALPHDEFARWLLYNPMAIPTLHDVIHSEELPRSQ